MNLLLLSESVDFSVADSPPGGSNLKKRGCGPVWVALDAGVFCNFTKNSIALKK